MLVAGLVCGLPGAVSAQICSVGAPNASYGTVSVLNGNAADTTTSFSVSCSFGIPFASVQLCLQFPQGTPSGAGTLRYMSSGANQAVHQIFSNSARTVVWGSWGYGGAATFASGGVSAVINLGVIGTGSTSLTVFGRFAGSQQDLPPGTYTWTGTAPVLAYGYGSGGCGSSPGNGNDNPGTITWTAIVSADCNVSTTPVNFGSLSTLGSTVTATGSVNVQCTRTTPYSISLGNGLNASGSQRRMRLGATLNYINYGLFTDAAGTNAWTSSTSATSCTSGTGTCVLGTGTGFSQTTTVYGRIPAQTTPPIGIYSDTVVVTITY